MSAQRNVQNFKLHISCLIGFLAEPARSTWIFADELSLWRSTVRFLPKRNGSMRLRLIRHPKPLIEPGICYGRHDCPAEDAALAAITLLAELPPGLPLWSSPLIRCRALAERLHPKPIIDNRLAEMHFGDWEGRCWDDIPRAELDAWAADVAGYAPPGGESPRATMARLAGWTASLREPVVAVSHKAAIRALLALATGWNMLGRPPHKLDWRSVHFFVASGDGRVAIDRLNVPFGSAP